MTAGKIRLPGLAAAPLALFIPLTIFARIAAKGHDIWQLAIGSILSISITFVVLYLYGFNLFGQLL